MSLSSLLLKPGGKAIDKELDALFKSNPAVSFQKQPTIIPIPGPSPPAAKKRKLTADEKLTESSPKRLKSILVKPNDKKPTPTSSPLNTGDDGKGSKKTRKAKAKAEAEESEDEEGNSDLENAYLLSQKVPAPDDDDDGDDAGGTAPLLHESLQKGKKHSRSGPKVKFVPSDETPERRDQRTVFVGNLSVEVAQKRPLRKQLQRHILAQIPSAKIESVRFRSIPFQTPTSKLPTSDDEESASNPTSKSKSKPRADDAPAKQARPHDRDRASTWRDQKSTEADADDDGERTGKKFLSANQKKKIAFINQEFHSTADTVNAYVVFAHPAPPLALGEGGHPAPRPNLPPPRATLDPYDAARLAAARCDGTLFMERMIRVDLVGGEKKRGGAATGVGQGPIGADPKLSVFVGNLDFASKEEDLRVFFEGVVSAERGPPDGDEGEGEGEGGAVGKPKTWVTRVRIVRDQGTQLGKGFAYVQFADRECVDEILAVEEGKLKFAKRKLRVQRCKTVPGSSAVGSSSSSGKKTKAPDLAGAKSTSGRIPAAAVVTVPKGDPLLGEKLAHMPKDARKEYKSADADRVARRLAKKKARIALGNGGVKMHGKDRERVRKKAPSKGGGGGGGGGTSRKKESKGRARSDKSLARRNAKK